MGTGLSSALQIIVAEDNPADAMLVRMALQNAGLDCELRVIEDGEDVIAFLNESDADARNALAIDLLLLDMHLPKRDGEDILKCLRSMERYAQTPVIVMTSSGAPADQRLAEKHAALHYFRKPVGFAEFMELGVIARGVLSYKEATESESPGAAAGRASPKAALGP